MQDGIYTGTAFTFAASITAVAHSQTLAGQVSSQPLFAGDAGLSQYPRQKVDANLRAVAVGNGQHQLPANHVGMSATGERTSEAQLTQPADKVSPRDRDQFRHESGADL